MANTGFSSIPVMIPYIARTIIIPRSDHTTAGIFIICDFPTQRQYNIVIMADTDIFAILNFPLV